MNIEQVPSVPTVQPEVTEHLPVVEAEVSNETKHAFSVGQEVKVKRTSGLVESGWRVSGYHEAPDGVSELRVEVVSEVPEGLLVKMIPESELLTAQGEQIVTSPSINTIAEQAVGNVAAEAAPEVFISEAEKKLSFYEENMLKFKALSEDERIKLWRYRDAVIGKKEAQDAGNGQLSTQEGQRAGQALNEMSPEAAELANWYSKT